VHDNLQETESLINFLQRSPSSCAGGSSRAHGIPSILGIMNFHYRIHKRSITVPTRTHLHPD